MSLRRYVARCCPARPGEIGATRIDDAILQDLMMFFDCLLDNEQGSE